MILKPLVGKQKLSVQLATAHGNLWEGAVRSSKTICSIMRFLMFIRTAPPGPIAMIGKTEDTLFRNVVDVIRLMVGNSRCKRKGRDRLEILGREVYFLGANNEAQVTKVQGMTLVGLYCDELSTWPESVFNMATTRLSVEGAQWFATTNPAGKAHWLMTNWCAKARTWVDRHGRIHRNEGKEFKDLIRFSFTIDDNPTLPASYVERIKGQYTGLFYRRYILGEWIAAEGAIYDMWDPDKHIVKTIPDIQRWIGTGIDYGTKNPFDALLLGLGEDRKLYLASEYRYDYSITKRRKTDAEYSLAYRMWLANNPHGKFIKPKYHVLDPQAAHFFAQLQRDKVRGLIGADNSVLGGIGTVSNLLAQGLLFVHESCKGWISEVDGYVWDDKASAKGDDEPLKQDDHAMDAGRYILHTTPSYYRPMLAQPHLELAG